MELRENEFYCDVQVLVPHDDMELAYRLVHWLDTPEARNKALQAQRVRVLFRLNADGSIEAVLPGD